MDWPKCEVYKNADFCGDIFWKCVGGRMMSWSNDLGECLACNGTGERDLTADEADKFIKLGGYRWWPNYESLDPVSPVLINLAKYDGLKKVDGFNIYGPTLTKALNVACRAVKEKENGLGE